MVISVIASLIAVSFFIPSGPSTSVSVSKTESAYDRVMRTGVLKCGYYEWPGTATKDPNTGEMSGLVPDLMETVSKMLDLKVEFVQSSALGLQTEELKRGVYDTFCIDSYYVFSMGKFVDFGTPYAYFPMFIYGRADDVRFKQQSDLNRDDVTFVGIDGDLSVTLVPYLFPKAKVMTLPATSDAAALPMTIGTGKADAVIMDPGLVKNYNDHNARKLKVLGSGDPVAVYPVGFSVAKGDDKLLRMLDSAVSAMTNTGMIKPLLKQYEEQGGVAWSPADGYVRDHSAQQIKE